MRCNVTRKFAGGQTQCTHELGHDWFHFDEVAYWDDGNCNLNTEWQRFGGFIQRQDSRGNWYHVARTG